MNQDTPVRISEVSRELGLSPSRIRQLADAGVLPSTRTAGGHRLFDLAAVRAALARRDMSRDDPDAAPPEPSWRHRLTLLGLAEHEVWRRVVEDLELATVTPAGRIMGYSFQAMLNNAIDHSRRRHGHHHVVGRRRPVGVRDRGRRHRRVRQRAGRAEARQRVRGRPGTVQGQADDRPCAPYR